MFNSSQHERYSRQIALPPFGEAGQHKLLQSKVLVVGAGGLGCPVLQYLTAAGVGTIGIADFDTVSLSNLHRQILYSIDDIGKSKATIAAVKLSRLNDDVHFEAFATQITNENAWEILERYDLVVDGSDNFSTRYLINDACVLLNKPLIYGSISRFEGQVALFNVNGSANYRCVFPEPPMEGEVPNCAEAGVLGVLPGVIGSLMANEAIKHITGIGTSLTNKLLTYNALYNTFYEMVFQATDAIKSKAPKDRKTFESFNYNLACSVGNAVAEVDWVEFNALIAMNNLVIADVREYGEQPVMDDFKYLNRPLSGLKTNPLILNNNETIVLFCQSGIRSREAAAIIQENNPGCSNIYSLKGGIVQWKSKQQEQLQ